MTLSGAKSAAARTGLRRGLTEFRQQWTNREDLVGQTQLALEDAGALRQPPLSAPAASLRETG